MENILQKIVKQKKLDLARMKSELPLELLKEKVVPSKKSFYETLSRAKTHFILECKKASPSKGEISSNYRPGEFAKVYSNYASAISVLTDSNFFKGSFEHLEEVRKNTDLPILCKDFVIDPYSVYRARYHGANAILLILAILSDEEYKELSQIAHSLDMGVLTEVANIDQAKRARSLKAKVVGINNRDLNDFSIDMNRTKFLSTYLSEDQLIISESGIENHSQVKEIGRFANGFLVGGSLMRESDLDLACRNLVYGENKVCGVRTLSEINDAHSAGASYVGFNFVKSSPRFISKDDAIHLREKSLLPVVGVFCNQEVSEVSDIAMSCKLASVQLHGDEDDPYISTLRESLPSEVKIWKAITSEQKHYFENPLIDLFVIDSKELGQFGGTGKTFDWNQVNDYPKHKIILAGGIGPDNAKEASSVGCLGLDLNSKLEDDDNYKDNEKVVSTFNAIKNY